MIETDVLIAGYGPVGATLAALLGKAGIVEAVLPWTRQMYEYEFRNAAGDILMRFDQRGVEAPSGWAPSYMFHQPALEEALRKRVADFPSVDVRLGTSFKSINHNDANGITATITADSRDEQVRARFLIGADGGGSIVRRQIDGELFDYGFDKWLDEAGAQAALIRPDRYVCGTGNPDELVAAFNGALRVLA